MRRYGAHTSYQGKDFIDNYCKLKVVNQAGWLEVLMCWSTDSDRQLIMHLKFFYAELKSGFKSTFC